MVFQVWILQQNQLSHNFQAVIASNVQPLDVEIVNFSLDDWDNVGCRCTKRDNQSGISSIVRHIALNLVEIGKQSIAANENLGNSIGFKKHLKHRISTVSWIRRRFTHNQWRLDVVVSAIEVTQNEVSAMLKN